MKRFTATAVLLALFAAACGPDLGPAPQVGRTVAPEVRERVKMVLFERLALKQAEVGARFPDALPEIQDEIAADEDFENWEEYLLCLRGTEQGADLALTEAITERMSELLADDETPEESR